MGALSRWAVNRPWYAIGAWIVLSLVIGVLGTRFAGTLNDSFSLPDTESLQATQLLGQVKGAGDANSINARVVWSPESGQVTDATVKSAVEPALKRISELGSVTCVTSPYGQPLGADCPSFTAPTFPAGTPEEVKAKVMAAIAATQKAYSPISPDGTVAYATVTFKGGSPGDVPLADSKAILAEVKALNGQDGLQAGAGGQVLEFAGTEPPSSEGIGLLVALIILLVAFGSLVAAGLPLITAVLGLGLGLTLVNFVANFADVATFAPTLAAMIGLGVGIDYSLFVINRFRQAIMAGHDPKDAAHEAVRTSGRAVVFAASTVIIALLGLFVMRINFFNGLALAASGTVLMVMLSAVWLLPALLSLLGTKSLAIKMPWARKRGEFHPEGGRWAHYGRWLQKRRWITAPAALLIVLTLAFPMLSLRLGFADASGQPVGTPSRIAYDLNAKGFGPGSNGPFFVVAQLPKLNDTEDLKTLITALENTEGVAKVLPNAEMIPAILGKDQQVVAVQVVPESGPQDLATSELLNRLRTETIPPVRQATGVVALVGGEQAIIQDFSIVLGKALPLFLAIVMGLGFLALMVLFRSAVVSLTAVVTSLLSFSAAMGITVAIFQWGWLSGPLGITATGPIFPFLPVMVFAILFGLSMDYQVFLVSRMQEEWQRTGENDRAVRRGLAGSGRVVLIAGAIMASVFAAFIPATNSTIKLFGISLASAVIIDAFLVRLVLVPSVMNILGKANWWLPKWLDSRLPHFDVEGADEIADDPELEAELASIVDTDSDPVGTH